MAYEATQKNRVEKRCIRELISDLKKSQQTPQIQSIKIDSRIVELVHEECIKEIDSRIKYLDHCSASILDIANKHPQDPRTREIALLASKGGEQSRISLDEIFLLCIKGHGASFKERNPFLSSEDISRLADDIEAYQIQAVELQQLQRAEKIARHLKSSEIEENEGLIQELTHDLVQELTPKWIYNPREHPKVLFFEWRKNIRLRPDQISSNETFIKDPKSNLIMQRRMGSGKTEMQLPLLAIQIADGTKVAAIMVPEPLLEFLSDRMELNSGQIFHQITHRIQWEQPLPVIMKRLIEIRDKRDILLLTDSEMHNLALRYQQASYEARADLPVLREIKSFFKNYVPLIMDEVDILLKCRHESHQAIGKGKQIDLSYIEMTTKIYDLLLTDPKITSIVSFDFSKQKKPGAKAYNPRLMEEIKPILVEGMLAFLAERNEALGKYLKTQPQHIKDFILCPAEKDKRLSSLPVEMPLDLKRNLRFLRIQIQTFLTSLDKIYRVHYGFFPTGLTCGPFLWANKPNTGAQFGLGEEIMNSTIQGYHKALLSASLIKEQILHYRNLSRLEAPRSKGEATTADLEYIVMVGEQTAKEFPLTTVNETQFATLAERISNDPLLLHRFLAKHVLNTILVYAQSMISTPQTLPDMFFSVKGFSGTVGEKDTFHDRFTVIPEEGTDGNTLSLLWRHSRNSVSILSPARDRSTFESVKENSLAMLREMMQVTNFSVLLDSGALFPDVDHKDLAKEVLRASSSLENVIYYEGEPQMVLSKDLKTVPANTTEISIQNRFTILDQQHCRGIHLLQEEHAKAIVTINKNMTLQDLFQSVWRMRGLAKSQRVYFFIPFEVREILISQLGLSAEAEITVFEVLLFVQKNQAQQQAENNLFSIQQKMHNCLLQGCMEFLDKVSVAELPQQIFRELHEVLFYTIGEDTHELEILKEAHLALAERKKQALLGLAKWYEKYHKHKLFRKYCEFFSFEKIEKDMDEIIQNALIKDKEKVNEILPIKVLAHQGLALQLSVHQQINTQLDVNQNLNMSLHSPEDLRNMPPSLHLLWERTRNLFAKSYFKPMPILNSRSKKPIAQAKTKLRNHAKKHKTNNLMTVSDALLLNKAINGATIKNLIDKNLLISLDQIFTVGGGDSSLAFDKELSKPPGFCLIIQDTEISSDIQLLMISGEDAEQFKKLLYETKNDPIRSVLANDKKVALYFPGLSIVQQGHDPIDIKELEKNWLFQLLIVQYKFLAGVTMDYSPSEEKVLRKWLSTLEHIEEVEKLFVAYFLRHAGRIKNYHSSLLKAIFIELASESRKKIEKEDTEMTLSLPM